MLILKIILSRHETGTYRNLDLNLRTILPKREVIQVLRKGPKYRPPLTIDWTYCRRVNEDAFSSSCKNWCKTENADKKIC